MATTERQSCSWVLILVGLLYTLIGIGFALPSAHAQTWRLSAWVVSALVFAFHAGYECSRRPYSSRSGALHLALAAALGAFGLAVAGIIHGLAAATSGSHQRLMLLALIAWPILTGVPAFLVGLASCVLLRFAIIRKQKKDLRPELPNY